MMQGEMIGLKMKASYTQINTRIITQMVTRKKFLQVRKNPVNIHFDTIFGT